jgi:histidyl-tRNA synthetase
MNHGQLTFPYKRYQIQPVWRADRPQRGRYREFYQCDADVVGSTALLNEVELLTIYAQVFEKLGIETDIRINSRKVLSGMAEAIEETDRMMDITIAIDKVDKIGLEGVKEELRSRGLNDNKIDQLNELIFFSEGNRDASNKSKFEFIKKSALYIKSAMLQGGIKDIEYIITQCEASGINNIRIDLTIARGLNYYTGAIVEVNAKAVTMGSIGGGGRYDDLTGLFGVPGVPGVGVSFGVDRIYEQFKYAEKKNIPYVIIIGSKELAEKSAVIKDTRRGEQQTLPIAQLSSFAFL